MDHHRARTIRITTCGYSELGRIRTENQDHFLIADLSHPPEAGGLLIRRGPQRDQTPNGDDIPRNHTFDLGPPGALALVADGMGGAAGGELASRLATECIHEALATYEETGNTASLPGTGRRASAAAHHHFARRLRQAVESANSRLFRLSERDPRLFGMGTTATVAAILGDTLYLAQIGDSRAYLVRRGTAHQLTPDQSRVQALVDAGILTPEGAEKSSERNIILQALGPEPKVDGADLAEPRDDDIITREVVP
jgi:protein phosphatase